MTCFEIACRAQVGRFRLPTLDHSTRSGTTFPNPLADSHPVSPPPAEIDAEERLRVLQGCRPRSGGEARRRVVQFGDVHVVAKSEHVSWKPGCAETETGIAAGSFDL